MNLSRLLPALLLLAVALPGPLEAKSKKNNRNNQPLTKKGAPAELPVVQKVTEDSLTVGGKLYMVSGATRITVDGEDAPLSSVKQGMQIQIAGGVLTYGKTSQDTTYRATRIAATQNDNLKKKAAEANKKAREQARKNNNRNRR